MKSRKWTNLVRFMKMPTFKISKTHHIRCCSKSLSQNFNPLTFGPYGALAIFARCLRACWKYVNRTANVLFSLILRHQNPSHSLG